MATAAAETLTLPDDPIEQLFDRGVTGWNTCWPARRIGPETNSSLRWGRVTARPALIGWR